LGNGVYILRRYAPRRKEKRGKVINKFGKVTLEIKVNESMEIYERQLKYNFGSKWHLIENAL